MMFLVLAVSVAAREAAGPGHSESTANCTADSAQAEAGVAEEQNALGECYFNGNSPHEADNVAAVFWFRKSAAQDYGRGQFNLGHMYEHGLGGLELNAVEAVSMYRLGASHGDAPAQTALGYMYLKGIGGLTQDYFESVRLFRLSAAQGNTVGQFYLGFAYQNGLGVKYDPQSAYAWWVYDHDHKQTPHFWTHVTQSVPRHHTAHTRAVSNVNVTPQPSSLP
jgi:TPR repeat protein